MLMIILCIILVKPEEYSWL